MTYNEIRAAIEDNLTDQEALLALLTPANVETVERCAPGLATSTETYQPNNLAETYTAGSNVAFSLYDDKAPPFTVDGILDNFTSGNIFAAQLFASISSAVDAGNVETEFFDATEEVLNQTSPLQC